MATKSFIFLIFLSSLLLSCHKSKTPSGDILQETVVGTMPLADDHNSANSVDWDGTYIGVLPCADCEGINTSVRLNHDFSYVVKTQYMGKNAKAFERAGTFKWNDAGNTVLLSAAEEMPDKYFVGENRIIQLDKEGRQISGELAEKYVLKKISKQEDSLVGKYWKLIELNGKPIKSNSANSKEMHLKFEVMNHKVNGFAGCNSFFGLYKFEEGNKLSFSNVGTTKMACLDGNREDEFFKALSQVDNYTIKENTLLFKNAQMTALAKFELMEKK